jgi:hypothetical protein
LFISGKKAGDTWSYKDTNGNQVTATVKSIGPSKALNGLTYQKVYNINYVAMNGTTKVRDEDMYWDLGAGLIQDVDNLASPQITRVLTSNPVTDILIGTWTGKGRVVVGGATGITKGNVTATFNIVPNTLQAYTGTLTFTPTSPQGATDPLGTPLTLTVVRGPFDQTRLHITAQNLVVLGEMSKAAGYYKLYLHGSDTGTGYTFEGDQLLRD